jgi:iron complex transport system ATP-binding protein
MITLEALRIGYPQGRRGTRPLTVPLSFTADAGDMVGIVGPNGVGKSTLLRTLARQQEPLGGTLLLQDKPLESYGRHDFARRCSFVPAGHLPVNRFSVRDTVAMARYPYTGWQGRLSPEDEEVVVRALEWVGLTTLQERLVGELSDGERQRTLIARALAQETPLVLLDEPTAFLDIPNRYEVLQTMRKISQTENKIFIFSSHDLEFLLETADKIWLIYPDEAFEGSPEDLLKENRFDPLFRNTGITYHLGQGLHIPPPAGTGTITLKGGQHERRWVEKALTRAGFSVATTERAQGKRHISLRNGKIWLQEKNPGPTLEFDSIYSLISYLKRSV